MAALYPRCRCLRGTVPGGVLRACVPSPPSPARAVAAQELISGCPPPRVHKFQERFPLGTLGADFIYINKNQKKWGWGGRAEPVVAARALPESGGA